MDKDARGVRHPAGRLEHGGPRPGHLRADRSADRRVQRTRGLLQEALTSLLHEKSYHAIAVKEILARANVGRSTFYAHFRDKDELLVSGIHEMLGASTAPAPGSAGRADRILRFSLPIFERIERHRGNAGVEVDPHGTGVLHERLQRVLAELVAADLRQVDRGRQESRRAVPSDLIAEHVAATFVRVLNWWVECPNPLPAKQGNDLFRALVVPTLSQLLD